jgi:hypothetical protein
LTAIYIEKCPVCFRMRCAASTLAMTRQLLNLPPEALYLILADCNPKSLANLLLVNRQMNIHTREVMADRLRGLFGIPRLDQYGDDERSENLGLMISAYSPNNENHEVNWFQASYQESNNGNDFHYMFDTPYSSRASSSASTSDADEDELESNPETHDLYPQSKFTLQPSLENEPRYVATLDIPEDDYFGQIILRLHISLHRYCNIPQRVLEKAQRISTDWFMEDEYLVHNHELTYRLRVQRTTREPVVNTFGESIHRYQVEITELVLNTGFLLDKVEAICGTQDLFAYRLANSLVQV